MLMENLPLRTYQRGWEGDRRPRARIVMNGNTSYLTAGNCQRPHWATKVDHITAQVKQALRISSA